MNGLLEVRVEGTRVVRLVATPPIAAKVLAGSAGAADACGPVLVLVGSAAGLLEGDRMRLRFDLAAGARLTVRTTAATIAHPCHGGGSTGLAIDCVLGPGSRLVWLPEPLIACAGCDHGSRARLSLGAGATATWLDTVTLGRTGEVPGRFWQRLDVELGGRPLLREALRLGTGWDGPAVLGSHRHVAALHLLGRRVPSGLPSGLPAIDGVMQLAGPGTTARFLAGRGDELTRKVAAVLPLFLDPFTDPAAPSTGSTGLTGSHGNPPKEALHV